MFLSALILQTAQRSADKRKLCFASSGNSSSSGHRYARDAVVVDDDDNDSVADPGDVATWDHIGDAMRPNCTNAHIQQQEHIEINGSSVVLLLLPFVKSLTVPVVVAWLAVVSHRPAIVVV